jgi:hypothetical protein
MLICFNANGQDSKVVLNNGRDNAAKTVQTESAEQSIVEIINPREISSAIDDRDIPLNQEFKKNKSDWVLPLDLDLLRDELLNSINGEAYIKKVEELGKAVNELARINEQLRLDNYNIIQSMQDCCSASNILHNEDNAFLLQNTPNPVSNATEFNYFIPSEFLNAEIKITNINGKALRSLPITQGGHHSINFQNDILAPGSYIYSLIIDGKMIDSKVMLITK